MAAPLSFKNDEQADERLNPANDLHAREQAGYDREFDDISKNYDKTADPSQENDNIAATREQETSAGSGGWQQNYTGKDSGGKGKNSLLSNVKGNLGKKGPLGFIITLMLGGGILGGGLLTPGLALIHIKEVVENKIDTMASVVDTRMQMIITSRMKAQAVKGKCSGMIKIKCRFNTFSSQQLSDLKEKGIKVVDGNGHEIEGGTKPAGDTRMIFPDGDPKGVKASQLASQIKTDPLLRDNLRTVYPTRFNVWNDKIAGVFEKAKGVVRNPKWTESEEGGDTKANQMAIDKNLQQAETGGQGKNTIPDAGDYNSALSNEEGNISSGVDKGTTPSFTTDIGEVAATPPAKLPLSSKIKSATLGTLNPTNLLVDGCDTYKYGKIIIYTTKITAAVVAMRVFTQFASTADKMKAGNATPNDVSSAMNILEKQNKNGDAFGESTGYSYAEYGKPTNTPVEAGASGSTLLSAVTNSVMLVDRLYSDSGIQKALKIASLGTVSGVSGACSVVTNIGFQVLASLANIAVGVLSGGTSFGLEEGTELGAKAAVTALIRNMTEKIGEKIGEKLVDKEARKATLISAGKSLLSTSRQALGFFMLSYMIQRFLVPYLANVAMGTVVSGSSNGVAAMDTMVSGAGALNVGVSQSRGMTALSRSQATAFLNYNNQSTATYVADMQAQANPFDINDPYSISNSVGFTLGNFISSINPLKNPSSLLSAPATIFSSIFHPATGSQVFAASNSDQEALMNQCQDDDATQGGTVATDPFCNPIYGFDNMSMLQNTTPDQVVDYMTSNGYIDANGDPTGDYATYSDLCFTGSSDKVISNLTDGNDLDPKCYKQSKSGFSQQTYDMFHLYQIDKGIIDQMDDPYNPDTSDQVTAPQGNGDVPQGTAQQLMTQLLASPNIQFQTPSEKSAAQEIAKTGHATQCGAPAISPLLLGYLLYASQQFKLTLGVFTDGHGCGDGFHSNGIAIDINGVADAGKPFISSIGGSGNSQSSGSYTNKAESQEIVKFEMYLDGVAKSKQLRFNQKGCVANNGVTPAATVNAVNVNFDACTHLHMDTWEAEPGCPTGQLQCQGT